MNDQLFPNQFFFGRLFVREQLVLFQPQWHVDEPSQLSTKLNQG